MSSLIIHLINELEIHIENDDESDIWGEPGTRRLDIELTCIADLYLDQPDWRTSIRDEINRIPNPWPLVLYIRRNSLLIKQRTDVRQLERGLAVASMLNGRCDYRDVIVSLVFLRGAAIRANIDSLVYFETAATWSTSALQSAFQNVNRRPKSSFDSKISSFEAPVV